MHRANHTAVRRTYALIVAIVVASFTGCHVAPRPAPQSSGQATRLDFSSIDAFWHVADILAADREPTDAEWQTMLNSTGYRLGARFAPTVRRDMEIALRPSRRATFDSLARIAPTTLMNRPLHLAHAYADRAQLQAYRDSVTRHPPVERAMAIVRRFLPPHAIDGKAPPLVAFALFADDAYSVGADAIVVDLEHVRTSDDLTLRIAHEFHHSFVGELSMLAFPTGPDASVTLVRALNAARNEGIADLIDKPVPLRRGGAAGELYSRLYNEGYARTPAVIRSIDSALTVAALDSTKLDDVGRRVTQLLPSGGHFNGAYMAREIAETFGTDSLFPGVRNAFAFWRAYAEAEVERGNPPPFSPPSVALLNSLETRYLHRASSSEHPSAGYSNSAMRARALSNAR